MRRGTFKDLPASLGLLLYDLTTASSITLDGNNLIASIENTFGNGSNPATTATAANRRSLGTYNGFATSYSADTNHGPHLVSNTSGLPIGNADRHMTWVALSMDGVVCGYRGDGGRPYWVDNPFPDYRIRTDNGDFTGTGSTDQNSLHGGSLNHTSGVTTLTVDGQPRGSFTVALNTQLPQFGFAGAQNGFFPMKGHFLLFFVGKRAATSDEQAKIDSAAQFYHGKALPSGHPYAATPWMVDDGAGAGSVTPVAATHTQSATSPGLSSRGASVPVAAFQTQSVSSPTIGAKSTAQPDSAVNPHVSTSPAIGGRSTAQPDNGVQTQLTTSPALSPRAVLAVDSSLQGHQATSSTISNVRASTTPDSVAQAQSATQPMIQTGGSIAPVSGAQSQLATAPTLAVRAVVSVNSVVQPHVATSPTVSAAGSIAPTNASHAQAATSPALVMRYQIAPTSSVQSQSATSPMLTVRASLLVDNAVHTQLTTSPSLFAGIRPLPPSSRTVRSYRAPRVAFSTRPSRLAA